MYSASIDRDLVDTARIHVTPVQPNFVGRVSGLDLGRGISDAQRDAINVAMDRFAVLVFPGQALNDT